MKRIILTLTLSAVLSGVTLAQKIAFADVPTAVAIAYKSKFTIGTIADKDSWELDYDNYRVDFMINKVPYSATFDKEKQEIKIKINKPKESKPKKSKKED